MGMTLVEKIFAFKLKRKKVTPGEFYFTMVDMIVGTDVTVPLSIKIFEDNGFSKVIDSDKLIFINDHFVPAKDINSAQLAKSMQEFAKKHHVKNYFEIGRSGICHVTLPEQGYIIPGDLIIGADSHTCTYGALGAFAAGVGSTDMAAAWASGKLWFKIPETVKIILKGQLKKYVTAKDIILFILKKLGQAGAKYKSIEFLGPAIKYLNIDSRLTICNMAVEAGAKTGIMIPDNKVKKFLKGKTNKKGVYFTPDEDAKYSDCLEIDISGLTPQIAAPYSPANVDDIDKYIGLKINQVVIGSCTNGRFTDFNIAHRILKNHKIHPDIKLILIPGSPIVLKKLLKHNMLKDFIDSGAVLAPSTCGPCIGGHMGILAENEIGLFTTNRNFMGRNGAKSARVYLCSPAIAAFSAIKGEISGIKRII